MQKKPLPNREYLTQKFHYNPVSGEISSIKSGNVLTSREKRGYINVGINGSLFKAHRVVYKMYHGDFDESLYIDHIDRNTSNNKISNLRLVTHKENHKNRGLNKNNTSGFVGIYWHKLVKKWYATLWDSSLGRLEIIGYFLDKNEAKNARDLFIKTINQSVI